jgi:hypothetical protein
VAAGGNADATQRGEHIARITAGEATDEQGAVTVHNAQAGIAIGVRWAKAFIGAFGEPLRLTQILATSKAGVCMSQPPDRGPDARCSGLARIESDRHHGGA